MQTCTGAVIHHHARRHGAVLHPPLSTLNAFLWFFFCFFVFLRLATSSLQLHVLPRLYFLYCVTQIMFKGISSPKFLKTHILPAYPEWYRAL